MSLGAGRVDDVDADEGRSEEAIDAGHRLHEVVSLPRRQRREQRGGEGVAAPVEQTPLGSTADGQAGDPDAAIPLAGGDLDEPLGLQSPQQPADVPGVEPEAFAQRPHIATVLTDLPQQPGCAERSVAGEVVVVQGADPLRHRPVEPPNTLDVLLHII